MPFMPYPLPPRRALRVVMSVPLWRRDGLKGYVPLLLKPNFAWKLCYSRVSRRYTCHDTRQRNEVSCKRYESGLSFKAVLN
jgi:hypothetical protein